MVTPARDHSATLSVLVINGQRPAAPGLACYLTSHGVQVMTVADTALGQVEVRARHYDCVVVDLGSPGEALIVMHALRAGSSVPILIITATDDMRERITAVDAAADIATATGLALRDLSARIHAMARRPPANQP